MSRPPGDLLAAHLAAAEALAATAQSAGGLRLYAGEEGEALAAHLAALEPAMQAMPPVAAAAWPALFDAAMAGAAAPSLRATRGREHGAHPRVEILGLLEARLLTFDRVVLGALDETVWPLATDPGPWMSRPMRQEFGLPEPEARIGRVCADFLLAACSAPVAVLSRAARRGGAPTVPARWMTRIETFLQGQDGLALEQSPAMGWAGQLDRPARIEPCARPAPRPRPDQRPARISVTQVETLIADPYAFYARHVLRLRAIDPLDADAGALDYGNLVHAAMAGFVRRLSGQPWPGEDAARAWWADAARMALEEASPRPGLAAFWTPRLDRIGGFAIEQEAALRSDAGPVASLVELRGELPLRRDGREVVLTAYADRIDVTPQGLRILDYKTGQPPSGDEVKDGRKPQLTLEAAIAAAGGFEGRAGRGCRGAGLLEALRRAGAGRGEAGRRGRAAGPAAGRGCARRAARPGRRIPARRPRLRRPAASEAGAGRQRLRPSLAPGRMGRRRGCAGAGMSPPDAPRGVAGPAARVHRRLRRGPGAG
ncbi:PD-(D/E)XK nuclease family protein [Dankookia sp. P2]|uniref:PD-(D/E)XK nuclease family protein n=1 Tax=Dankookia sp. P2 TaxID=3423955 RepID=UPI003D6761EF